MKNTLRITTIALLTFVGSSAFSQSLNFKGGYTTSNIIGEGMEDSESTETVNGNTYTTSYKHKNVNGINLAVGYEFRLSNRLSLETGFKYQKRGFQMMSDRTYEHATYKYEVKGIQKMKLSYVDLPIVLNMAITTGNFRIYARTGIYFGVLTGGKMSNSEDYASSDGDKQLSEYSERIEVSDFDDSRLTGGFIIGAGVEYKGVYVESNFNMGALSLNANADKSYTQDISFSLGYKLKFKQ